MSVPAWLSEPIPPPACPPPPSDAQWARPMLTLCASALARIRPEIVEPGDAAEQACASLRAFQDALRDHPRHGRNWWAKHRDELKGLIRPWFPGALGPEPELEGAALQAGLEAAFGTGTLVHHPDGDRLMVDPRLVDLSVRSTRVDGPRAPARDAGQGGLGL